MNHAYAQQDSKQGKKAYKSSKPVSIRHVDSVKTVLRPKLKIGRSNDKFEQEADRVAEQVMRMPDSSGEVNRDISSVDEAPSVQCLTPDNEKQARRQPEEEEEELLQLKAMPGQISEVSPAIEASITSLLSGGRPLSQSVRAFFESRFESGFSRVRVHDDAYAANVARSINARAFTLGQHIVFAAGEYAPDATPGRRLLAHELTHVVQQNRNPKPHPQGLVQDKIATHQTSVQRSPARGVDPTGTQRATQTLAPQIFSVPELENEQRVQRNGDNDETHTLATPTLNFGVAGASLTRGESMTATVNFTPGAGETLTLTQWSYTTPGHGTVRRSAADASFQSTWSGIMALSGELELQYTTTPVGGTAGAPQTLTQAITVNDRSGTNWQSSVTDAAEGALSGKSSPPRVFSDLGYHEPTTSQADPTTVQIADGPNDGFTYVTTMAAGTYTSTPTIHPDLTTATSTFQTFHSDPSILNLVVGSTKSRVPNAEYSALSTSGGLSFTVPSWVTFYKAHTFYEVRATATTGGRTVPVLDSWWELASNDESANVNITDEAALRTALNGGSGSYSGAYTFSATPRGSWEGFVLMQGADILTGTQSHEYVHATHSHRANFKKMVRALDPRKVLERNVSAPGHTVDFNSMISTLIREILRPNHEIVDEAASATAESFVAQSGVTMAGVNENPATGNSLGTVWNIDGDNPMMN